MNIEVKQNTIYKNGENGNTLEHKAFSTDFSQVEIIRNSKILVLENYYKYKNGQKSNFYCLNHNLVVDWFVPTFIIGNNLDVFVGFTIKGNQIFANTWNCFRVEIDGLTGKILSKQFTK